jgi:hypothetical protein
LGAGGIQWRRYPEFDDGCEAEHDAFMADDPFLLMLLRLSRGSDLTDSISIANVSGFAATLCGSASWLHHGSLS